MKQVSLDKIRPIWTIDDDNTVLSKIGSYSRIFELKLPAIFTMSNTEYDRCLNDFNSIFSVLPDYTIIHKIDIYYKRKFDSKNIQNKNEDFLKTAYKTKFNEAPLLDHKTYFVISQSSSSIKKNNSLTSLIFKNNFVPKELKSKEVKKDFDVAVERVKTIFKESLSFDLRALDKNEIEILCNQYENLNFGESKYSSEIFQNANQTKIGSKFISSLAINSLECLPNEYENTFIDTRFSTSQSNIKFSIFHPIGLGFKENHIVNQVWIKESKEDVKNELKNIDNYNKTFIAQDTSNPLNLEDSESYAQLLEEGNFPVSYHSNVILWDSDQSNLDHLQNKLIANYNTINFRPNVAWNEILPLFWSCYPGNIADLGYYDQTFKLLCIQASALAIFETTSTDNISDFGMYLSDRYNGTPLYVDISDLPMKTGDTTNRNKMIIGPSGSGKSFTTNHMVNSYLDFNTHMVIVDVGDSYERLCKLRGGTYLTFTTENPISFNPFYVERGDIDEEFDSNGNTKQTATRNKINIEKKESLIKLIFTLWKKNAGDESKDEDAIIREGLNQYYDHIDNTNEFMDFNSYFRFMVDKYFPKIAKTKQSTLINADSFENVLKMFYDGGEYDYLLNSKENIDLLNQKMIIFELDNIKDHTILFPIVTLMIMDTFITKMRLLKGTRKVLLLEEAWKAITKDGMAEFLKYLFKTVRKHFGEAWLVTQELDDIIGNKIVKDTVLKNCGAKILLDMREYANDFDAIQAALSLSPKAKEQILSLNRNNIPGGKYKEVFIGLGNEGTVYGINVSKEEYSTYTTEKKEKEEIELLAEKFGDLETGIKIFADKM
ncbi:TraG family conjugative transposon ATPase [uncultured Flavobacterium sp.]|uniref:TraG family conjugative transposon ATPase n=1 Tax=uncultured Flavobacterium sp. TaxID=165435 RepID=UPI002594C583|nr:TraG family conjugative transposon ATPase [uncultured Flavobacterium sp.]